MFRVTAIVLCFLLVSPAINAKTPSTKSLQKATPLPEVGLGVEELVVFKGYPVESHEVETEDGYLLTLHRIPYGPKSASMSGSRGVVLLMPGLLCSSSIYVIDTVDKSLGYRLADLGYDVWIGNPRGTTYSRKHVTLDPDNDKSSFWDFSFHELGYYDVPAFIDYILEKTGEEKLFYIGFSQGTTAFYVTASTRPEYNEKIRLMTSLAPVAFMSNMGNELLALMAQNTELLSIITSMIEFYEILPHWDFITEIGNELCNDDAETQQLCANILYAISGQNEKQLNKTMIPLISSNLPAGASIKQFVHYAQEINSGYFRHYDYGILNLVKYGSLIPPDYEVGNIVAPVALFYGNNDLLSAVTDVEDLIQRLPNVVHKKQIDDEEFGHLDFLWAIDLNELVNDQIIEVMSKY